MDKKLVKFNLADEIKSEAPAGYVESLEKLVNDIVIPRELEKMCTQEGRVYNHSFADYQKLARDIWGDTISVTIKNAPHRVLCGSVGSANHQNAGYHTYWRLIADDGTHSYQAQEQHCAAECICKELQVFANQNNGRLQWLVKSLLAKQIGYQALRQKMGLQSLHLGADDEIKSIYNIKKGATISGDAMLVNDVFLNTSWDNQMRRIADKVSYGLRALAPLLCDGSVIDGDSSKNCIFVSHPSLRCGEDIVGSSYYKHNVDHCLYRKNCLLDPGVHELARIINNKIEFGRRLRGSGNVVETEPVMPGVTGAKNHSDVYDNVVTSTPEPCVRFPFLQNGNKTLIWAGVTCVSFAGFLMCVSLAKRCAEELVAEREKSHKKEIVIDRPDSVHNQRGDIEWHNVSNARNGHSR